MSTPFSSVDHCAVAPGRCRCGKTFPDGLALDTHIMGAELAFAHHRDVAAALSAIHAHAAVPQPIVAGSCTLGCHGFNADFDCQVHGGMRGAE